MLFTTAFSWVVCASGWNVFWVIDNHGAVCGCCNKLIRYSALMLHDESNRQSNVLSEVIVAATNGLNSASVYQPGKWLAIKITQPLFNGGRKMQSPLSGTKRRNKNENDVFLFITCQSMTCCIAKAILTRPHTRSHASTECHVELIAHSVKWEWNHSHIFRF